jgi:hypothetical protein
MKSKNINFKWFGSLFILAIFFSFAMTLPSVSAQGEATPTPTETLYIKSELNKNRAR